MPTWRTCSWRNAWCCRSRTPPRASRPRLAPSSGSYTPVLVIYRWSKRRRNIWSTHTLFLFFFFFLFSSTLIHVRTAEVNSTWLDVVSDDAYMLIAVWTRVFMPEADHVAQLMDHNAKLIAVLSYGDSLRAAASPPHIGATPAGRGLTLIRSWSACRTNTVCFWTLKELASVCN